MSRGRRRYRILDVFTDTAYGGNPLALLPEAEGLTGAQMQLIAREFNLSETAFVLPPRNRGETHRLRIFTPARELPFAGHPTIGAALALAEEGWPDTEFVFGEGIGPVRVSLRQQKSRQIAWFWTTRPPETGPLPPPADALAAMLGLRTTDILADKWGPACVSAGVPYLVVPLRDGETLAKARLDLNLWQEILAEHWAPQVYLVTALDGPGGTRFRARMFAPAMAIPEDPATGSAAAALPAWLVPRLGLRDGVLTVQVEQGIQLGRPSLVLIEIELARGDIQAVRVGGTAAPVAEGHLKVPE